MAASKLGGGEKLGVVALRISVPKGLIDFLKGLSLLGGAEINPKLWAERELVQAARATIDSLDDGEYLQATKVKERYGLQEDDADP